MPQYSVIKALPPTLVRAVICYRKNEPSTNAAVLGRRDRKKAKMCCPACKVYLSEKNGVKGCDDPSIEFPFQMYKFIFHAFTRFARRGRATRAETTLLCDWYCIMCGKHMYYSDAAGKKQKLCTHLPRFRVLYSVITKIIHAKLSAALC